MKALGKSVLALIILNEIRGIIIAAPILYGMYLNAPTLTSVAALAGITASLFLLRKLHRARPAA